MYVIMYGDFNASQSALYSDAYALCMAFLFFSSIFRNTYYLSFDKEISKSEREGEKHHIVYYQWVPLILMVTHSTPTRKLRSNFASR